MGCRWLYKVKYKVNDILDRHKAIFVSKGDTQQSSVDFVDTFYHMAKFIYALVLLALTTQHKWNLLQLDINNSFFKWVEWRGIYVFVFCTSEQWGKRCMQATKVRIWFITSS